MNEGDHVHALFKEDMAGGCAGNLDGLYRRAHFGTGVPDETRPAYRRLRPRRAGG